MARRKALLGHTIYIVTEDNVFEDVIGYIGKDSFIVENFECKNFVEFYFDDYNSTWTYSLNLAFAICKNHYKKSTNSRRCYMISAGDGCWVATDNPYEDEGAYDINDLR